MFYEICTCVKLSYFLRVNSNYIYFKQSLFVNNTFFFYYNLWLNRTRIKMIQNWWAIQIYFNDYNLLVYWDIEYHAVWSHNINIILWYNTSYDHISCLLLIIKYMVNMTNINLNYGQKYHSLLITKLLS